LILLYAFSISSKGLYYEKKKKASHIMQEQVFGSSQKSSLIYFVATLIIYVLSVYIQRHKISLKIT